jgi:iron complex outermembrane receptor protein
VTGYPIFRKFLTFAACSVALSPFPVLAQRASENVVASAQDAFGTSIGTDTIGLYNAQETRGFSPRDAGNFRIEGLYYDQAGNFGYTSQMVRSTTMRVGLSAQSYPFPSPTGIADIRLRLPGDGFLASVSGQHGPYSTANLQANVEIPRGDRKIGAVLTVARARQEMDFHTVFDYLDYSALAHWTPSDTFEVIAFVQNSHAWDGESPSLVFTSGPYLPPKANRDIWSGPDFPQERQRFQGNSGLIAREAFENWRLQAGAFRSQTRAKNEYSVLYRDTQPSGLANLNVRLRPDQWLVSYSGELRASGLYLDGPRRHTVHISAKGRSTERRFGGDDTVVYGPAMIGTLVPSTKPVFNLGPQSRDAVRQGTAGVSYVGMWNDVGEISAGAQRAFYRRTVEYPARTGTATRTNPWLYNGTLAVTPTDSLTAYASYTRGLEDSGIAPESAINIGEPLAASLTKQVDAGVRYRFSPTTVLVAGMFEVKKPYFDRDANNLFARVGALTHRGVEVSLSAEPVAGLKVVAGAMLLKARVSGSTVEQGLIAEVPPGRPPAVMRLNANYAPAAWRGFSLTAQITYEGSHFANRVNTFRISPLTTIDVGARYTFSVHDTRATLRFDVQNLTDEYIWTVNSASGHFSPSPARRYILRVAADF